MSFEQSKFSASEYANWVRPYKKYENIILTKEETNDVIIRVRKGCQKAKETIIGVNIGLLVKTVKQCNIEEEYVQDALSAAALGVLRATEKFDIERNLAFSTYMMYLVKAEIFSFMRSVNDVTMTESEHRSKTIIDREVRKAEQMGNSKVVSLKIAADKAGVDMGAAGRMQAIYRRADSMDNDDVEIMESQISDSFRPQEDSSNEIDREKIMSAINEAAKSLSPDVRAAIYDKMGIYGEKKSYAESARELGCTRAWVAQLADKGLTEIRMKLISKGIDVETVRDMRF